MAEPCHRRSSNRIAKKRSLEESHASDDTKRYHQPIAGDTPTNNDCGILPGE